MRRLILLLAFVGTSLIAAPPQRPPVVEYNIDVELDPAKKTLVGRQRITWRNPADHPVPDLQFHLYLNAFRDEHSTFMRESGGSLRDDEFDFGADSWGSIDVRRISVSGRGDITTRGRFIQPDTPDPQDRTVAQYLLPRPVAPRETLVIDVEFTAKLPKVFARTGWADDDFFMIGQWFPKLGVYETRGMRGRAQPGWNCHQFHANSEFYANFGDYDVSMTLPADYTVGATGRRVALERRGKSQTQRFVEKNVHDFAWTAGRGFHVEQTRFDPARDVPAAWRRETAALLGVPEGALRLQPINVTLLMQKEHADQTERHRRALFAAIAWCGLRYGAYPYSHLTLVDPPQNGNGAGGMEYPGIFTTSTSAMFSRWPLEHFRYPEIVTIHEFAHQYWYGMVASNEFEEPWLDEGFTSFTESEVMRAAYRDRSYELPGGIYTSTDAWFRGDYLRAEPIDPIVRHAWGFSSDRQYGVNAYAKPALALRQLEGELGRAAFARVLRSYFDEWSFRHPSSADFFRLADRVAGRDATTSVRSAFYATERFDLFVQSARSDIDHRTGRYITVALVARRGGMSAAADVHFRLANGTVAVGKFEKGARWTKYRLSSSSPAREVVIDPSLVNIWDVDLLNNSRRLQTDERAAAKLTVRSSSVLARALQLLWELL